jgi:hypothetical protein
MYGSIFLAVGLGCAWIGRTSLTRYERSPSSEPFMIGESIAGFLGAALNLAAAAVLFFS